jgi:MbtH protein
VEDEQLMENPFDAPAGEFLVLVNDEGQYSLWPSLLKVPDGWAATGAPSSRDECLGWIEAHWTDQRPRSLAAMSSGSGGA